MSPKLKAALAYIGRGWKLVPIEAGSKRPYGLRWNLPENLIADENTARAYWGDKPAGTVAAHEWNIGVHLGESHLASFDVDDFNRTVAALKPFKLDVADLLDQGWRIESGKPNKGRAMFDAPEGVTFKSLRVPREESEWRTYERNGRTFRAPTFINIFELRAAQENLQDVLPPSIHPDTGKPYQSKALPKKLKPFPSALLSIWKDWPKARVKMLKALGVPEHLHELCFGTDARSFSSDYRDAFNETTPCEDILERNGYRRKGDRYQHEGSQTTAGIRPFKGHEGWFYSHNYGDPLYGSFDAWTAYVVLEHGGDVKAAEAEFRSERPEDAVTLREALTRRRDSRLSAPVEDAPVEEIVDTEPAMSSLDLARDITDLLSESYAPCVPIIEGLLYPKGITMFYGKQKEGKSFALMQVATAVAAGATLWQQSSQSMAKGKPFEGFSTRKPTNVLMLCTEDHGARLQKRFAELLRNGVLPMPRAKLKLMLREDVVRLVQAYAVEDESGELTIPEGQGLKIIEQLIREWATAGFTVIMLDTLDNLEAMFNATHKGKDVKRREYAQGTFYDTLADELGIAIIGTGHLRKGKGKSDAEMDAMDLVNTTGAANAGISHFWAFTKLPDHCCTIEVGDKGKERRFFATGREIESDPSLHFMQGVEGMGGLWVNMGTVSDHEIGAKAHEYLSALEALLQETGEKFVTAEEIAKACDAKPNTVRMFLKRWKKRGLTWGNGKRLAADRGVGGGWTLV